MKILITCGYTFMEEQLKRLEALGCEVVTWPNEREPVSEYHYDADILFSYRMFEYTDITHFKNLKLIQLTSSGLDHVPLELIRERGILLCSARGIYSIPIAEWVILKVLEIYKKAGISKQPRHVPYGSRIGSFTNCTAKLSASQEQAALEQKLRSAPKLLAAARSASIRLAPCDRISTSAIPLTSFMIS
jgi:lactate dehydrogenase-like 2-hydroxyacid dehydrogenase